MSKNTDGQQVDLFVERMEPVPRTVKISDVVMEAAPDGLAGKAIQRLGMLSTPLLAEMEGGKYEVVAGRGRIQDLVKLGADEFHALVVPRGEGSASSLAAATLGENFLRRPNPGHEAMALKEMVYVALKPFGVKASTPVKEVPADRLAQVFSTLATELGYNTEIMKARWRILTVPQIILDGVLNGEIKPTVAVEVSKKPEFVQDVAAAEFSKHGKLTGPMVKKLQHAHVEKVVSENADLFEGFPELPDPTAVDELRQPVNLTEDGEPEDWFVIQSIKMMRLGYGVVQLRELIKEARQKFREEKANV